MELGTIKCKIEGTSPLLMARFDISHMESSNVEMAGKTKEEKYGTPEQQAYNSAYWMEEKGKKVLCIPAENLFRCIPFKQSIDHSQ